MLGRRARAGIVVGTVGLIGGLGVPTSAWADTTYTLQDVQKHGTSADCWSIVNASVYNLTAWIPRHEGGSKVIAAMCGIDGTTTFASAHGLGGKSPREAANALARYRIGAYDASSAAAATTTVFTMATVAKHGSATDCWSVVDGGVYNLTNWITQHPGGAGVVTAMCGSDGTGTFNSQHQGQASAIAALKSLQIGVVDPKSLVAPTTAYTLADVAKHATAADCWSAVNGGVYDLTAWIPKHPGGKPLVIAMCGIDGTAMYESQHKGKAGPDGILAGYKIGTLSTTAAVPAATKTFTMKQVRRHNTAARCWSVVGKGVYNLTAWIPKHPGGKAVVSAMCGTNGTKAYRGQHKGSASAWAALKSYRIGTLR
jgi:cytochrome b involved in lipid metabolism